MKYWNKDKRIREQHWHRVQRGGWNYLTVKRDLQLQESTGKFYLYYGSDTIWFECEEDAMWFELRKP
jgi:hypothetical protein